MSEGRTIHYVAGQLGHGAGQTLRTYGHVIASTPPRGDRRHEIRLARGQDVPATYPRAATSEAH